MRDRDASGQNVRVALVCADPLWEYALTWLLHSAQCDVVGRARDLQRVEDCVEGSEPQVLVIDVDNDVDDARRLYRELCEVRRLHPETHVIISCRDGDHATHDAAAAGGAAGIESRDDALGLIAAVQHAGRTAGADENGSALTLRQVEILRLVADGRTNREVARTAWVTEETVKFHLANIYRRLGVHNRGEAILWAIAHGVADGNAVLKEGQPSARSRARTPRDG